MVSRSDVRKRRRNDKRAWSQISPAESKESRYRNNFTSSVFYWSQRSSQENLELYLAGNFSLSTAGFGKEKVRGRAQSTIPYALAPLLLASYPAPGRSASQLQGPDWAAPLCLGLVFELLPHGTSPTQAWPPLAPGGHLLPKGLCKVPSPPAVPACGMEPKNSPQHLLEQGLVRGLN